MTSKPKGVTIEYCKVKVDVYHLKEYQCNSVTITEYRKGKVLIIVCQYILQSKGRWLTLISLCTSLAFPYRCVKFEQIFVNSFNNLNFLKNLW